MDRKKYTETNRTAWNKVIPIHHRAKEKHYRGLIDRPGYSCLDEIATGHIKAIGIAGRDTAQLGCNDGRELLSLKNLGARRCVGFDISDAAIEEAKALVQSSGIEAEFVRSDIFDIETKYYNAFDFIYNSIGFFAWLPDLPKVMEIGGAMLRKNGVILIYDEHPFLAMIGDDPKELPPKLLGSYFNDKPALYYDSLDYYNRTEYDAGPQYNFAHTLSEIINSLIGNGFEIIRFQEYEHDTSVCYPNLEKSGLHLPLSYIIAGRKK